VTPHAHAWLVPPPAPGVALVGRCACGETRLFTPFAEDSRPVARGGLTGWDAANEMSAVAAGLPERMVFAPKEYDRPSRRKK
jgi:hypothetical protein